MKRYGKESQTQTRKNPISDPVLVSNGIKKSVVSVLSKTDNFGHLINNTDVVNKITEAVFSSIYKKYGKVYFAKNSTAFDSMVENIIFNTQKVCQIEEAKQQITKAASVLAADNIETIRLGVVQASLVEKLDTETSKDLDFFESNLKNEVDKVVYAGANISLKTLPSRKDLLYLDLILVAEGTNGNKDTIPAEELESRYLTLIGMPLVEEHINDAIRGVFYHSELIRIKPGKTPGTVKIVENGGRLAVRAKAYVYKSRFPREAYVLKDREAKGILRYSVELAFGVSECSFCKKQFKTGESYCEHLIMRNQAKDMNFSRVVRDIYFIGGAYTTNPAEKSAISLEVTDPTDEEVNKKVKSCVNTIDDNGKVGHEAKASNTNNNNKGGEKASSQDDGGHRMHFEYDSIEELLGAKEVSAVIEAQVSEIIAAEREDVEQTLEESERRIKAAEDEQKELKTALDEANKKLEENAKMLAEMEIEKRVSDAILDLKNSGYTFDSDEEIKVFADKIAEMSEENANYIVDLMKKTVITAESTENTETEEETSAEAEETEETKEEDLVKASQNADGGGSADTSPIEGISKSWDNRIKKLVS